MRKLEKGILWLKTLYFRLGVVAVISVVIGYAVGNYLTTLTLRNYEAELIAKIQELQVRLGMPPVEEELRVYTRSHGCTRQPYPETEQNPHTKPRIHR